MTQQHPPQGWGPGGQPPQSQQPPQYSQQQLTTNLADGEWHRLHKLTPWLGIIGGIFAAVAALFWLAFSVVGGIVDGDFRLGIGTLVGLAAVVFLVVVALIALGTILSYRNKYFRLTAEVFEMRSGVIGKTNRQARLDRLQSVNLNRTVLARLFGLTILETSGAGKDADIKLSYLGKEEAEVLRAEILRRASGAKKQKEEHRRATFEGGQTHPAGMPEAATGAAPAGQSPGSGAGHVAGQGSDQGARPGTMPGAAPGHTQRRRARTLGDYLDAAVEDFATPELGAGVPEQAVVRVSAGRIAGAGFLSVVFAALVMIVALAIALIPFSLIMGATTDAETGVVFLLGLLGLLGLLVFMAIIGGLSAGTTMISSLNYTIAGTPDGIRVGRGALNQTSDTVPPGRIHAVQVRQPWLWRPFKWYEVKVDRADLNAIATADSNEQAANQRRQVILPVGTWDEVQRVLALVLPMHMSPETTRILTTGMSKGAQDTFVPAPARSWWLHPIQWKSLGYAIDSGVVYLRRGRFSRRVSLVPGERIQSVTLHSSPLKRAAGVVSLWLNTVGMAVSTRLPGVDASRSVELFDRLEDMAVRQAAADTSHRWAEAQARSALATARMAAEDAMKRGERIDPYSQRMLDAEAAWLRDQAENARGQRHVAEPQIPPAGPPVPQQDPTTPPTRPNDDSGSRPPHPPMEPHQ